MEQKRKTEYKVFLSAVIYFLLLGLLCGLALTGKVPGVMSARAADSLTASPVEGFGSIDLVYDETAGWQIRHTFPRTIVYKDNTETLVPSRVGTITAILTDAGGTELGNGQCRIEYSSPTDDGTAYVSDGLDYLTERIPLTDVFKTGTVADGFNDVAMVDGNYALKFKYIPGVISKACYSNVLTFSLPMSTPLPLPEEPTKEGHTFTGWYYDEACTQPYDGSPIYEDTQLYAGWEIHRFTVTLNANGGVAMDPLTVDWNTVPELTAPEREGHTFIGWYDGDTLYDNAPITADKTLTAHWKINTYTVTFMHNGEVYKTFTVEWGTTFQTVMNAHNLTYYTLLTTEGSKMSKATPVKEDMTVELKAMSDQEKRAEFFAKNWWVLIIVGAALIIATAAIVTAVHKRR